MAHLGRVGTATADTGVSTLAITLTAGVPVGATVLVGCVWEAGGGTGVPTISSVVDSSGNTYTTTPDVTTGGVDNVTVAGAVLRGTIATALDEGDTITVTISGGTRSKWALQADAFDDLDASPLDEVATTGNTSSSSATPSTGTTAETNGPNRLLYAIFGFGQGRTVTIPEGWSGDTKVETTAGSGNRALQAIWKYVTAADTYAGTITLSSASTFAACIATYAYTPAEPEDPPVAQVSQLAIEVPQAGEVKVARVSQLRIEVPQATLGTVRVSQLRITVPSAPGQAPYTGLKAKVDGKLWNSEIWAAGD